MNDLTGLKDLLRVDPVKRMGTISELTSGSAIITDFLDRKFKVTVPDELDLSAGDVVISLSGTLIGKTKLESVPKVYFV